MSEDNKRYLQTLQYHRSQIDDEYSVNIIEKEIDKVKAFIREDDTQELIEIKPNNTPWPDIWLKWTELKDQGKHDEAEKVLDDEMTRLWGSKTPDSKLP